ncbi:MAG: hypothetical protein QW338_00260 [Conexivisphaerales archaeon]
MIQLLNELRGKRVAVIGDCIVDRYSFGTVSRVSPEATVPLVEVHRESYRIGDSANSTFQLASLGVNVRYFSVVDNDPEGMLSGRENGNQKAQ